MGPATEAVEPVCLLQQPTQHILRGNQQHYVSTPEMNCSLAALLFSHLDATDKSLNLGEES